MDKYIRIVADTNDGDYLERFTPIGDEDLQRIVPVIEAIHASNESHNWATGECSNIPLEEQYPDVDEELLELFDDYVPYGEYGVHTIKTIEVYVITSKTILL